jgi:mannonate dehydratase
MKITFRWYGREDKIPLEYIKQIPCISGVVSAVYDVPVGEVWSEKSIDTLIADCHALGLECEVIESVPVHEDIKLGKPSAKGYIEAYKENIRRLGARGVKCICYNFMPVFDWLRSDLKTVMPDGSNALTYKGETVLSMNPLTSDLSLPGWDSSYTKEGLKALLNEYKGVNASKLRENLATFLKEIIPVAEESGVKMAIHPDDPPWGIFGLPRIVSTKEDIKSLLDAVPSVNNGLTLCTGSLGVGAFNNLKDIAEVA